MKLEAAFLDKVSGRAEVLWTSGDDSFGAVRDKGGTWVDGAAPDSPIFRVDDLGENFTVFDGTKAEAKTLSKEALAALGSLKPRQDKPPQTEQSVPSVRRCR